MTRLNYSNSDMVLDSPDMLLETIHTRKRNIGKAIDTPHTMPKAERIDPIDFDKEFLILRAERRERKKTEKEGIKAEKESRETTIKMDVMEESPTKVEISVKKKRHINPFRIIRNTTVFVLCVFCCLMGGLLIFNIRSEHRGREKFEDLRLAKSQSRLTGKVSTDRILPEYASIHEANPDMAGWLSIEMTPVDYPVMYRQNDNDYYLNKNFDGEYDANGMLIMDKRCDPKGSGTNMLIHGHNMKSGMMFGALRRYMEEGYAADHKTIHFDTLYEKREYEIIAVFQTSVNSDEDDFKYYNYIDIENGADFIDYIEGIKAQSVYETDVTANYGEKLITLSTCDYTKDNGRLVVVGKMVEKE